MDARARIGYVDVVVAFATIVAFAAVSPWVYELINKVEGPVDPLTSVLLALSVPMVLIMLILSVGVSARSR